MIVVYKSPVVAILNMNSNFAVIDVQPKSMFNYIDRNQIKPSLKQEMFGILTIMN